METKQFPHFYAYYNYLASLVQQQTWEAAQKYAVLISCNDAHADLKFLQVGEFLFLKLLKKKLTSFV